MFDPIVTPLPSADARHPEAGAAGEYGGGPGSGDPPNDQKPLPSGTPSPEFGAGPREIPLSLCGPGWVDMPLPSGMPSPEWGAGPLLTANAINAAINATIVPIILPFQGLDFRLAAASSAMQLTTPALSTSRTMHRQLVGTCLSSAGANSKASGNNGNRRLVGLLPPRGYRGRCA